jgi:hypothetical protein
MKTAMQELWEYIDANYHEEGFNLYAAKELSIEKEKEQIIDAGNKCQIYNDGFVYEDGEDYYNQTYNQNK